MRNQDCEVERFAGIKSANRDDRKELGVLIVDDERLMRVMLKLGLARYGFNVLLASNGEDEIGRAHV